MSPKGKSLSLKALTSKTFSVKKAEAEAVRVARILMKHVPDEGTLHHGNCYAFASYIASVCTTTLPKVVSMLAYFMPCRTTPEVMVRIALALINRLPGCAEDDYSVAADYDGNHYINAHCRITNVSIRQGIRQVYVSVEFLPFTSELAGHIFNFDYSWAKAVRVMSSIGIGSRSRKGVETILLPQEMFGCFVTVKFGRNADQQITPLELSVTASENKHNKALLRARMNKACTLSKDTVCAVCPYGRDACALACRKRTKKGLSFNEDNRLDKQETATPPVP